MAHTHSICHYHIVFSTYGRRPLITEAIRTRLYGYAGGIIRRIDGDLLAIGGIEDHIHLLAGLPIRRAVSDAVRDIKANSSRFVRSEFPSHKSFGWQLGSAVFTVSKSLIPRVVQYIECQREHHRTFDYDEELRRLLNPRGE